MPRLFFTGRQRIERSDITLRFVPGDPLRFTAHIDLAPYRVKLHRDARVYLEAYHNTMVQRFDFGTVRSCLPLDDLVLTRFDSDDRPWFRLRIVDEASGSACIIGACDRVGAVDPQFGEHGGRSLLPLVSRPNDKMRGELWRIEFDDGGSHRLEYNSDISALRSALLRRDPLVLGIIVPNALRQILRFEIDRSRGGDGETNWLQFGQQLCGDPPPILVDAEGEVDEWEDSAWVDRAVQAFCRSNRFLEEIRLAGEGDAS